MYEAQFMELYKRLGVVDESDHGVPLHKHCDKRGECWEAIADRTPPAHLGERSHISLPWVGPNYCEAKLLVVGENLNECGGLNAATMLVREATREMMGRSRRVFKGGKCENGKLYRGTLFYFIVGCYVAALIPEHLSRPSLSDHSGFQSEQLVASVYDYIAYTNQVKCSPSGERSRPSSRMWENCGNRILKEEIKILNPEKILVLGIQNNRYFLGAKVLDSEPHWTAFGSAGKVLASNCSVAGCPVQVFAVPHPSYFRTKRDVVVEGLVDAVRQLSGSRE
jgi:hypothetical protein